MEDQNNNEFEFDGRIYPTYQEMVEAKRERNRKALEKTTTEITKKLGEEYNKMRSSAKSSSASSSREGKGATTTNHGVEDDDDDYLEEDAKADGDVQVQIEKEVEEKEQKKVRTKKGTEGGSRVSISRRVKKKSTTTTTTTTAVGGGRRATATSINTRTRTSLSRGAKAKFLSTTAAVDGGRTSMSTKRKRDGGDKAGGGVGSTKRVKNAPIEKAEWMEMEAAEGKTKASEKAQRTERDSLKGEDNEKGAAYSNAIEGWKQFYDRMKQEDSNMSYNQILKRYCGLACNEGVKRNTLKDFCLNGGITRPLDPIDGRKNSGPERLVDESDMNNFIIEMAEKCMDENENKKEAAVEAVGKIGFVSRAAKEKFTQLKEGYTASKWVNKHKLKEKVVKKIGEMKNKGTKKSLFE